MTGLTDDILSIIEKRQKKKENNVESTVLYQAVSTMKDYHLSPEQWGRLCNFDRKVLIYTRIMEQHYTDTFMEEAERKRDAEKRQRDMFSQMPKQVLPRRGR